MTILPDRPCPQTCHGGRATGDEDVAMVDDPQPWDDDSLQRLLGRIRARHASQGEWSNGPLLWLRHQRALVLRGLPAGMDPGLVATAAFSGAIGALPRQVEADSIFAGSLPDPDADACRRLQQEWMEWGWAAQDRHIPGGWTGMASHVALDYHRVLHEGLGAVADEVASRQAASGDPDQQRFHATVRQALAALQHYAQDLAGAADGLARTCTDAQQRARLKTIAHACRQVPWRPARNLHEALQAIHLVRIAHICDDPGPGCIGRLDRLLAPFLSGDGQDALLVRAFCAVCAELTTIPDAAIMLGGSLPDGSPFRHAATGLILDAIAGNRLPNPATGLAVLPGTDADIWEKALRMLGSGLGHPALFGDAACRASLERQGIAPEHACTYIHGTCTELTPAGRSHGWTVLATINLAQVVEAALRHGACSHPLRCLGQEDAALPDPGPVADWDGLLAACDLLMDAWIARLAERLIPFHQRRIRDRKPLVSALVAGCLERGRDAADGGAEHVPAYVQLLGLPNAVDSLLAIRRLVFTERILDLPELVAILDGDWAGHEELRQRSLHHCPHLGGGDAEAVEIARRICDRMLARVEAITEPVPCRVGLLTSRGHIDGGRRTCASADGRRAGEPLADCFAVMQGRAAQGPTSVLDAAAAMDPSRFPGGPSLNLHVPPELLGNREGRQAIRALLEAHLCSQGGFEVQITSVSRERLLAAQADPAAHADLFVRIGGYCDRFTNLDAAHQAAVIARC